MTRRWIAPFRVLGAERADKDTSGKVQGVFPPVWQGARAPVTVMKFFEMLR